MDKIDAFAAQFLGIPNYVGAWQNATVYVSGQNVSDVTTAAVYQTHVTHTSSALPTTFAQERVLHPTYWELVSTSAPPSTLSGNVGRNLIHNPLFNVAQRGTGPWSITNTYTADRWIQSLTGGTISTSIGAIIDANRVQIGDESPRFHLVANVVGGAGASDETYISQRIEDVRRLAGKTVTLSFWAVATSGTPKLGIPLIQIFGTGGSPSSPVLVAPQTVTLSTTYTRYSLTYTVPSIAGKTLGTNAGTDYLEVRFGMSCGASNNVNYGGIGQQSAVFVLWGVQLEIGNVATPLEKPDPRYDLANCQRMFCLVPVFSLFSASQPSQYLSATGTCPVTMRAVPTLTPAAIIAADQNLNTFTVDLPTVGGFRAYAISNNPGATSFSRLISCSADL